MWGDIEPKIRKLPKLQKISQFTFEGLVYIIGSKKEIDCDQWGVGEGKQKI